MESLDEILDLTYVDPAAAPAPAPTHAKAKAGAKAKPKAAQAKDAKPPPAVVLMQTPVVLTGHTGNNLQNGTDGKAWCANRNHGDWEKILIRELGKDTVVLHSLRDGHEHNLSVGRDGSCCFEKRKPMKFVPEAEKFMIEHRGETAFFVSQCGHECHGMVLQCAPDGSVRCANQNRGESEAFRVVPWGGK